jgi:hypothetical protein
MYQQILIFTRQLLYVSLQGINGMFLICGGDFSFSSYLPYLTILLNKNDVSFFSMIYIQMEALTGWPAKDEWDFEYLGDSNHPFIKANYPHHEGIWGWGTNADQVVMMIRNIKRSMVEYHDILWDIGYAKTWEVASANLDKLYGERPPKEDFFEWRDLRVMDEIGWYGYVVAWCHFVTRKHIIEPILMLLISTLFH